MNGTEIQEMRSILQSLILQTTREITTQSPFSTVIVEEVPPEDEMAGRHCHSPSNSVKPVPRLISDHRRQDHNIPGVALVPGGALRNPIEYMSRAISPCYPDQQYGSSHSATHLPIQQRTLCQIVLLPPPTQPMSNELETRVNATARMSRSLMSLTSRLLLPQAASPLVGRKAWWLCDQISGWLTLQLAFTTRNEAFLEREEVRNTDFSSLPPCQWCGGTDWRMRKDGLLLCACYFSETGEIGMELQPRRPCIRESRRFTCITGTYSCCPSAQNQTLLR